MAMLTIDKAGRIVLPKPLREKLSLSPGDALEVTTSGEQITLEPVRINTPLRKERGVWVFRTGEKLPSLVVDQVARSVREEREKTILGERQ